MLDYPSILNCNLMNVLLLSLGSKKLKTFSKNN